MKRQAFIYCIERIKTGKKYIGQHIGNISDNYWGSGVAINKAIKKYGKKEFKKYVLEYCSIKSLNEREIHWIKFYNTFLGEGYNKDSGGNSNSGYWFNLDKETKENIHQKRLKNRKNFKERCQEAAKNRDFSYLTKKLKGRIYTEETKQKMSKSRKGFKHTEEAKQKISEKLKGKKRTQEQCSNISKGTKGIPKGPKTEEHKKKLRKPVIQLDLEGNFIQEWIGVSFAGKGLGISYNGITRCCNNKQKTCGGFKWVWKN